MSRAMRYKNNKIAKIFLFCKDIDESMSYISSIREYDTRIDFIKKINYLYISDKIISKKEREIINNENIEKNKIKILGIKLYKSESWDLKLELVKKYIDENYKRPNSNDKNIDIKKLGKWINEHHKFYKNKHNMTNKDIYNKFNKLTNFFNDDKYKIYFLDNKTEWINKLDLIKKYINENNKLPSTKDKNNEIKSLSNWVSDQNRHYKNKKFIMSNEEIYNKWTEFINDNKYKKYFIDNETYWNIKLELVKKYINENNKRPNTKDKNNEYYTLTNWLSIQSNNYKNKNDIMKNENIYNKWTEFINDEKYKIYFLDNETEWINKLDFVKKYIDLNNKRPCGKDKNNEIRKNGTWIQTQISNYENKKQIMSNEDIYNKWTEFINNEKYKKYFFDNETKWNDNLELIKKYIDENNKLPSRTESRWIEIQNKNYKNKTQIMLNENIYNKWTEFINNDKYEKYFIDNETDWNNKLELVKKYIDENNNKPLPTNNNNKIKILGAWIQTQLHNYKNKKCIMLNKNIYNKWTEFINNYKKFFLDNETIWNNNLDLVKKYIDENNKKPSKNDENKELSYWISHQVENYKNKTQIMSNEKIYNKWKEFINNYKKLF